MTQPSPPAADRIPWPAFLVTVAGAFVVALAVQAPSVAAPDDVVIELEAVTA